MIAGFMVRDFRGLRSVLHRVFHPVFGGWDPDYHPPKPEPVTPDNPTEAIAGMKASAQLLREVAQVQANTSIGPDGIPDMLDEGMRELAERLRAL
jgi:hypothetical protein